MAAAARQRESAASFDSPEAGSDTWILGAAA
jgi:hypothetical protein